MTSTKIQSGSPSGKWSVLDTLESGQFYEDENVDNYSALRTAATRAKKRLGRLFRVQKETLKKGKTGQRTVVRVYRTK